MNPKINVVIPVYNEENTLRDLVTRIRKITPEILVVISKKSNDCSLSILKELKVNHIIDPGKGKGYAMRLAIRHVKEGILVFMDADMSHIPEDIPKLVQPIIDGNADLVIGSRFLGGSAELHGDFNKFLRAFFSMSISQIINWRFGTAIMDSQNGFRAIKAKVANDLDLRSKHTEIETEMDMKCLKKGYRIMEVPSFERKREFGNSNTSLTKHGWRFAWQTFINLF